MDEPFTMGLIKHNYISIINIDHLDVHPPLYYLLLKLFLQITTFWNSSLFVKIIFARLFSTLIGIISFYFLCKIIYTLNIKLNWKLQIFIYLFIPSIMSYLTNIRMYELASLFIIIECYELTISYMNKQDIFTFPKIVIFASLAAYTHYYAAISAGALLLVFFLSSILNYKKNTIKYLISGISFLVLCIPVLLFASSQFKYGSSTSTTYGNLFHQIMGSFVGIVNSNGILRLTFIFILLLSYIYIVFWSFNNLNSHFNFIFCNILGSFLFTILFAILFNIFVKTPFFTRYTYPIFSLYSFFIVSILCCIINKRVMGTIGKILLSTMSFLLLFSTIKTIKTNIDLFWKPSIELNQNINKWKSDSSKNINVNLVKHPITLGQPLYITQSSIYLESINKRVFINKKDLKNIRIGVLAHDNKTLFDDIFDNVTTKN